MAIVKVKGKYYAYFSVRVFDNKTQTYRIKKEYAGSLGSRRREAEELHADIAQARRAGHFERVSGTARWQTFTQDYFRLAPKLFKERTIEKERAAVKLFNVYAPHIQFLREITPDKVNGFQEWLKLQNKHGAHINRIVRCIVKLMKRAEEKKLVRRQKWQIRREKERKGKKNPFTLSECARLLTDPDFFWYGISLIGLMHGLRREELRQLLIYDIDFGRGILYVRWHKKDLARAITSSFDSIKDEEQREIPLSEWSELWLKEAVKRAKAVHCAYVFNHKGKMLTKDFLTTWYKEHCAARGIFHATPHRMRHSFATGLLDSLASENDATVLMGHSSFRTTQGYLGARRQKKSIQNLETLYKQSLLTKEEE